MYVFVINYILYCLIQYCAQYYFISIQQKTIIVLSLSIISFFTLGYTGLKFLCDHLSKSVNNYVSVFTKAVSNCFFFFFFLKSEQRERALFGLNHIFDMTYLHMMHSQLRLLVTNANPAEKTRHDLSCCFCLVSACWCTRLSLVKHSWLTKT